MTSAVVVGSGSAGRRHLRALLDVDPELRVTLVRRSGPTGADPELLADVARVVTGLDEALDEEQRIGIVAGPATLHVAAVHRLLEHGATVLVEKPLAADLGPARGLLDCTHAHERLVVGYHLRFGRIAPAMRDLLASGVVGHLRRVDLFVGQHLSAWRPGTDPSQSVSARHELGGGALLELSHELDALRFVSGREVQRVLAARFEHAGAPTDGVVDTVAEMDLAMDGDVTASVHLDMVALPARRIWSFAGTEGTLVADLVEGTITRVTDRSTEILRVDPREERDLAERRLIDHLRRVGGSSREAPACDIRDGLAVLELVEAARRSAATGAPAPLPGAGVDR